MKSTLRFVGLASLLLSLASAAPQFVPPTSRPDTAAARNMEVRLRKLHLVRPDLIPYPLAYEVYC